MWEIHKKNLAEYREGIWSLETAKRRREYNIKIDTGETIRGKGTGSFGYRYWRAVLKAETNINVKW